MLHITVVFVKIAGLVFNLLYRNVSFETPHDLAKQATELFEDGMPSPNTRWKVLNGFRIHLRKCLKITKI